MGKIVFYNDGTSQFICGQNVFDVTEGIQHNCKQNFVTIDTNTQLGSDASIYNLKEIDTKFVINPNIDDLYKK
ncbi:hypothetical protein IMG5_121250 [Ichthyophthirius multifiliis]|uniref:Uncharacterized protein n=1 Tax=Ichthyophthirius multifiliis TaxID=5932 RepID=G0QV47_ICHMU|nr:hypothetical protein IMG5_121250 [Ichthyophthirius multifiliis]EGR30921.1 hypothetical protein IMG5_121250 [Ichthyophthirius multifiliis]|eukprot:XP_004032508.1 hypothetical protein IMG5_121250 [Ichthyophthirius multifiliis]